MKNKIILFKIISAAIAVGGAFASVSANSSFVSTSVYIRYTTMDTSNIYCTFVGICQTAGTNLCLARVQIGSNPIVDAQARATVSPNSSCATAILASNTTEPPIFDTKILPSDAVIR